MIRVVDAITGSGKSSWAIQDIIRKIKNGERILYVTPYLSEIERLKDECRKVKIKLDEPDARRGKGSKSRDLVGLLLKGKNIVTTHACFDKVSKEFLYEAKDLGYTLYMDEVHEVVCQYYLSDYDLNLLLSENYIEIEEESRRVIWKKSNYDGKFDDFKNLCDIGSIYYLNGNIYMWTFPHSVFSMMKDVYVLTYLFKGQTQAYYYDLYNLKYEMCSIKNTTPEIRGMKANYELIPYDENQYLEDIAKIRPLISIYEGKLNLDINLSSYYLQHYKNDEEVITNLKNNISNYFRNILKGKSEDNMWTTLLDFKNLLKGKGYTKGFIEITARATNMFAHKKNLAYVYDRYMNPVIYNFFKNKGVNPNQDLYSASEIVQWVFRSAVRKGENINLYIPSKRMRNIFTKWINGELKQ